jgi:hypothetical protein
MPTWQFALFLMIKIYNCFTSYHYWVFVQHVEGWKQTISWLQVVWNIDILQTLTIYAIKFHAFELDAS